MTESIRRSLLPIIEAADNFRTTALEAKFVPFYLSLKRTSPQDIIGQIAPDVLKEIESRGSDAFTTLALNNKLVAVAFQDHLSTPALRSQAIEKFCLGVREAGLFAAAIGGRQWRNELYAIREHPFKNLGVQENAFLLERSACELFGVVTCVLVLRG
jgi:hypothetical protein